MILKKNLQKPTDRIILKVFPLKTRTKQGSHYKLSHFFSILEVLANARRRKKKEVYTDWEERNKAIFVHR